MREIKFRVWEKVTEKMLYPQSISLADNGRAIRILNEGQVVSSTYTGYDVPFMQYTGLKDKNGTEIYEGDICVWPSGINRQIIWDEVNACFSTPLHTLQVERGMNTVIGHHLEIIGNIYENPELLTN